MQRGRKPLPPDEKKQRGTFRKHRDAGKVQLVIDNNGPVMPEYVKADPAAVKVWEEIHPRVTAAGICEADSPIFSRYCMMEARARETLRDGEMLSAGIMTGLRQYEELLRIAGPKSRLSTRPAGSDSNPFSRNGRRA
jgi:hypothetical protein